MISSAVKFLPRIALRGPISLTNTQTIKPVYNQAVEAGIKCLENGCDACTAVCFLAKELTDANRQTKDADCPKEKASSDRETHSPINAFGIIAMDCKGSVCGGQIAENQLVLIKEGFENTTGGCLSIAAEPKLAEKLASELKPEICPACLMKHFFAAEKTVGNSPLGGICMDTSGAIGIASLIGSMAWVVAKSGSSRWSGYEKGTYCIFDSS